MPKTCRAQRMRDGQIVSKIDDQPAQSRLDDRRSRSKAVWRVAICRPQRCCPACCVASVVIKGQFPQIILFLFRAVFDLAQSF